MGRDRSRMREKKYIVPILPTRPRIENSEKNSKKIQKIKNQPFRLHLKPKRVGMGRERDKKKLSF